MVIDTSALVALLSLEPEAARLAHAMAIEPRPLVSAATWLETAIVIETRFGEAGGRELDLLRAKADLKIVNVDATQAELAREAWRCYGKGRHPAGLNFGDCFTYALAKASGEALLFKGEDFKQTDVPAVQY